MTNLRITNYIKQFDQLYHGGNWVDESFTGKLNHLKDEEVFLQPYDGVHSVAEIVWHITYWRVVNIHRLKEGNNSYRDKTVEKNNFLPVSDLREKGWKTIYDQLFDTQNEFIDTLREQDDAFLSQEYAPGLSFDYLIAGTIHHDYYHLGQIGLVVKILKLKRLM